MHEEPGHKYKAHGFPSTYWERKAARQKVRETICTEDGRTIHLVTEADDE